MVWPWCVVGDDVSGQCRIAEAAASLAAKSELFLRRRECVFQGNHKGLRRLALVAGSEMVCGLEMGKGFGCG